MSERVKLSERRVSARAGAKRESGELVTAVCVPAECRFEQCEMSVDESELSSSLVAGLETEQARRHPPRPLTLASTV